MDIKWIIGIVIGVIALAIGIYQVYLIRKRKKYPGQLFFAFHDTVQLFNSMVKNFPEINILYEDEKIDTNVSYVKASIFNDGELDLTQAMVDKVLSIHLISGYKWIKAKVSDASDNLTVDIIYASNFEYLIIDFNLFRKEEFFTIEGLVKVEDDIFIDKEIDASCFFIKHRIANTGKNIEASNISPGLKKPSFINHLIKEKKFLLFILITTLSIGFIGLSIYSLNYEVFQSSSWKLLKAILPLFSGMLFGAIFSIVQNYYTAIRKYNKSLRIFGKKNN